MSWRKSVGSLALLVAAAAAWPASRAVADPSPQPSPLASAAAPNRAWSEQRRFDVSWVSSPSPIPLSAIHAWTITVRDASGQQVEDARVTVLGGMPAHSHGLPTIPEVRNLGGGRYLIEGLKFHMPGTWVVAFRIKHGTVTDTARFELAL